jgi:2-dehydropantoate 2-reductase
MWSKLVSLAPLALSTAAAQSTIGEVLSDPVNAARLEALVWEACEVAARVGATVDASAVIARIRALPSSMRSSMERDIANGKAPELDAIAGAIIREADKRGITLTTTPDVISNIARRVTADPR